MSDRNDTPSDEAENGVLAAGPGNETTSISIIGGETVDVALPPLGHDDDDLDDDVTGGESGNLSGDDDLVDTADVSIDAEPFGDAAEPVRGDEPVDAEIVEPEVSATAAPSAPETPAATSAPSAPVTGAQPTTGAVPRTTGSVAATTGGVPRTTGSQPSTRRAAHHNDEVDKHALERLQHPRTADVPLQSRRIGEIDPGGESSDLLTAERLLDPAHVVRPEPEGAWQHFVYRLTGHRVNLGDSKRARARKELDRRIAAPLVGGARFVPVLSRKGGVGKTTVTTLLGMALADARDDRVIAIDANPDRGTLADRIARTSGKTVRDLARMRGEVVGFNDLSSIVARDETRLDVLASDADARVSEAFSDRDYHDVAAIAAHYYSLVLTDTGTGIVHSVMEATLELADQLVIVAGLSVEEARLASETLTWLETNGFAAQVRSAVVVLNTSRPGAALVRAEELESHFGSRVRAVVRMPYDPHIATGSAVTFSELLPETRQSARELAAAVVEGLRSQAAAG